MTDSWLRPVKMSLVNLIQTLRRDMDARIEGVVRDMNARFDGMDAIPHCSDRRMIAN
jgi:hypothetical protein